MFILSGIPISSGIAIGQAYILAHAINEIKPYFIDKAQVKKEIKKFSKSIKDLRKELINLKKKLKSNKMGEYGSYIDIHLSIINDPKISVAPIETIRKKYLNAEWALKMQMDTIITKYKFVRSRDDVVHDVAVYIGESVVSALEAVG